MGVSLLRARAGFAISANTRVICIVAGQRVAIFSKLLAGLHPPCSRHCVVSAIKIKTAFTLFREFAGVSKRALVWGFRSSA
jgi:hypothetical protein